MDIKDLNKQIDPIQLMDDVTGFFNRFVWFPSEHYAVTAALWCAHAHLIHLFDSTPRLAVIAPEKQSGKTRVLEVTESLVPNPMRSANTSTAALFRLIDSQEKTTVLLDEADTIWAERGGNEDLRGLINAGHRRGSHTHRMIGQGSAMTAKAFSSFAAVALAGIGQLPETVMDRSIALHMKRRAQHEHVQRWRFRTSVPQGNELRDRLADWAATIDSIVEPPDEPGISDRAFDVWEPLLAIADHVGGPWPARARAACSAISNETSVTMTLRIQLLSDIRDIWPPAMEFMATRVLIERLHNIEDGEWSPESPSDRRGKGLTANQLARMLRDYQIRSCQRADEDRSRGYYLRDFLDAWYRYLPHPPSQTAVQTVPSVPGNLVTNPSPIERLGSPTPRHPLPQEPPLHACAGMHCQVCKLHDQRLKAAN